MAEVKQGRLGFKGENRGSRRKRAGRRAKLEKAGVSHAKRAALASKHPAHVTMKLRKGMPSLRRRQEARVLFGVFADRYHDHVLRTPREVRNALCYVLQNARRHGLRLRSRIDPLSSAAWFEGWRRCARVRVSELSSAPVAKPHSWPLRKGWRRHGLLVPGEVPGPLPH